MDGRLKREIDTYNFIPLGYECTVSSALQTLGLRRHALPFDWTVSGLDSFRLGFADRFSRFFENLTPVKYNEEQPECPRDTYGFRFPHCEHTDLQTYRRRIGRFYGILRDQKPLIVFCKHPITYARQLYVLVENERPRGSKTWMIVATTENLDTGHPCIVVCNPIDGTEFNPVEKWEMGLHEVLRRIATHNVRPVVSMRFL